MSKFVQGSQRLLQHLKNSCGTRCVTNNLFYYGSTNLVDPQCLLAIVMHFLFVSTTKNKSRNMVKAREKRIGFSCDARVALDFALYTKAAEQKLRASRTTLLIVRAIKTCLGPSLEVTSTRRLKLLVNANTRSWFFFFFCLCQEFSSRFNIAKKIVKI